MTTLSIPAVKKFTKSAPNRKLASQYVALKNKAVAIRKQVNEIYKPIFDKYEFYTSDLDGNERIHFEDDFLYACDNDELVNRYYTECNEAVRKVFDVEEGKCPALIAEHEVIKKENEIVELMCGFMGVEHIYKMEHRRKAIELFMSLYPEINKLA